MRAVLNKVQNRNREENPTDFQRAFIKTNKILILSNNESLIQKQIINYFRTKPKLYLLSMIVNV